MLSRKLSVFAKRLSIGGEAAAELKAVAGTAPCIKRMQHWASSCLTNNLARVFALLPSRKKR